MSQVTMRRGATERNSSIRAAQDGAPRAAAVGRSAGPGILRVLGGLLAPTLFFLLFAALGIVHVTGRVLVVETGYRLSKLQAEGRELEREHHRLMLERATLTNPQRLETLARSELSMAPPSPSDIHSVSAPPEGAMASVPGTQRGPQ